MKRILDKHIKIISSSKGEFETVIEVDGVKHIVQTDDLGKEKHEVVTRIYRKGEILSTTTTDYAKLLKEPDVKEKLLDLMQRQHKATMQSLGKEEKAKTPSDYLDGVKMLLRRKNSKAALNLLKEGLEAHPDNPFLLSYYGCLSAIVEKNYKDGIAVCKDALKKLKDSVPFGEEFFYPMFYLNLGRAYLASGRKKDAVEAFRGGLKFDTENADLLWEIKKLGVRRRPPLSFLGRSNPLNKYIGFLLAKISKEH